MPNDGNTCVKGRFGFQFVHSPERLTRPLIRENGSFREASWDEALSLAGRRLAEIRDKHGPDGIAFLSSCRCTNEENYLVQKMARAAGKTNNVDQCATTCHAPTVAGLAAAFGSGAMTNSIGEIKNVQTLFVIGANPTEAHPIIGLEMKKALRNGAKLIVCDPRKTWMARRADVHIQHIPGTDNFLVNAMMNHIIAQGWHDADVRRGAVRELRGVPREPCRLHRRRGRPRLRRRGRQDPARRRDVCQGNPVGHLLHARHHRAYLRHGERAEHGEPGHALRPDRKAVLGRQPAPRPEQRPGRVRHGGHSQRLARATRKSPTRPCARSSARPGASKSRPTSAAA